MKRVFNGTILVMNRKELVGREDISSNVTLKEKKSFSAMKSPFILETDSLSKALIGSSPVAIIIVDKEGKVTTWNPAAEKIFGWSEHEAVGHLNPIIPSDALDDYKESIAQVFQGSVISGKEMKRLKKDGSLIDTSLSSAVLHNAKGEIIGAIGLFIDMTEQKKAESALEESERRFHTLFEESPVALWEEDYSRIKTYFDGLKQLGITNFKDYFEKHPEEVKKCAKMAIILNVNKAAMRMLDVKKKEEMPGYLDKNFTSESYASFREELIALASGKMEHQAESTCSNSKGETLDISLKLAVLPGHENTLSRVLVSTQDITDRKKAVEDLARSERFNRMLVEASPSGIIYMDADGTITYENPAMQRIMGVPEGTVSPVMGIRVTDIPPVQESGAISLFQRTLAGESIAGDLVHYRSLMGVELDVEIHSGLVKDEKDHLEGIILLVNDITNHKLAEEKLTESELKSRKIIEESPAGIILTDEQGIIVEWNHAQEEITGLAADKAMGKYLWDILFDLAVDERKIPELYERMKSTVRKCLRIHQPVFEEIPRFNTIKRTDGKQRIISNEIFQIKTQSGYRIGNITTDITEKKLAEDLLKRQKEELSNFARFMVHDIKNCLFTIDAYIQLLKDGHDKSSIEKILKQIEYLNVLLRRSLDLAEAGRTIEKIDRVDLNNLIEVIADITIPSTIKFSHDALPEVVCDNDKLHQVMKNLFENAVKHGSPKNIEVKVEESVNGFNLLIINDGKMIPPEIQKQIFDRGYPTAAGSTGLGLTIVKKVIEAHGWEINLKSTAENTVFQIFIPNERMK
ncbi:MAG: PAS domain S-box protein [Candidatus Odinarchaeota archaeon]